MATGAPSPAERVVAGSMGAVASAIACHPMDVVRTRMQADLVENRYGYTSSSNCLSRTLRADGFGALYRGVAPVLGAQALYKAVMFGTFAATEPLFENESSPVSVFARGSLAGAINAMVVCPVELVRNRAILSSSQRSLALARDVLRSQGLKGMYRGASATVLRDGIGVGCWFLAFRTCKARLEDAFGRSSLWTVVVSGAAGGAAFWTAALPFDALKSILQTSDVGIVHTLSEVPIRSLYKGYPLALARGVPSAAIVFTVQDRVSTELAVRRSV